MRGSITGVIASIGLGLFIATGDVACTQKTETAAFTGQATGAKPVLDEVPASSFTTQRFGVASWKVFMGRSQIVYEAYDQTGAPVQGAQFAWFKATPTVPAHLRIMMLDGTGAALRLSSGPTMTGSLSANQSQFLLHAGYDFQQLVASQGTLAPASAGQPPHSNVIIRPHGGEGLEVIANGPVHMDWTWMGVGSYVAGGAAAVVLGGAALAAGVTFGVGVAVVGGTALAVASAGMGLYSYVTENPNTPATPPAPVSQVTPDSQTGQMTATTPQDSTMSSQTFDQQWNQDMDALNSTQNCPSCSNPSSDLDVNSQNGDVQSGNPSDPNAPGGGAAGASGDGTGGSASDTTDPGAAAAMGGSGGSSSGGSSGGDGTGATQDQASQDQASQDQASQDQASQDQASQDQASQDQASQDQASQDQASQDQASQDQASQDSSAIRRRHHRHHHHRQTVWRLLYNNLANP
jgi:hypothetical protein